MAAAEERNIDVVKLLERGSIYHNARDQSPLDRGAAKGYVAVVHLIIERGGLT